VKQKQQLALSTMDVPAGGVVFALHTAHNTYILGSAKIDGLTANSSSCHSIRSPLPSPGAQLLANYDLGQTPCGSSDLVVLYGTNSGTICAYPNAIVGPGNYRIDESSLTITSGSS